MGGRRFAVATRAKQTRRLPCRDAVSTTLCARGPARRRPAGPAATGDPRRTAPGHPGRSGAARHGDPVGRCRRSVRCQPDPGARIAEDVDRRRVGVSPPATRVTRVAQLTPQELREMYIVRETLESASLAVAIAQRERRKTARPSLPGQRRARSRRSRTMIPSTYHRQSPQLPPLALTRPSGMHRLLHMLELAWNVTEPAQSMVHVGPEERAGCTPTMPDAGGLHGGRRRELVRRSELHAPAAQAAIETLPSDTGPPTPSEIYLRRNIQYIPEETW